MACDSSLGVCACRQTGDSCLTAEECCESGAECAGNKCFVPGVTAANPGQICTSDDQCVDANGNSYTCTRDLGSGTEACCTGDLQAHCDGPNGCCAPLLCDDNGWFNYNGFSKVCCAPVGEACNVDDDCCGHKSCSSNKTCG
jgi:hypothetical protein